MKLIINQLKLHTNSDNSIEGISKKLAKEIHQDIDNLNNIEIIKKSIDARKKPDLFWVYSVAFDVPESVGKRLLHNKINNLSVYSPVKYQFPKVDPERISAALKQNMRPVIIGSGPAGYMCAYMLTSIGLKPIVIERGMDVDSRLECIESFWNGGTINTNSNIQFGEGGAGTFSDGKLQTGVSDKFGRISEILKIYIENGAPEEIKYLSKPHIGTDILTIMVKNMRNYIENNGGEVRFNSLFKGVNINDEGMTEVVIEDINNPTMYSIFTDTLVIATGHSSRDTYKMLYEAGLKMDSKPFAVGLRVQHKQETINLSQYGKHDDTLPAADYKLTYQAKSGRGVYSFCMCPGGYVVNASSENQMTAVNGMSYHDRNGENANSAIVITVDSETFGNDIFDGMKFQEKLEANAYKAGDGMIPLQLLGDFIADKETTCLGDIKPAIKGQYKLSKLNEILPKELNEDIICAFDYYGKKIKGFDNPDALLCGVESRTSAPLRILRDKDSFEACFPGIYPCGEGAGYAGGITSAALDGLKVAEKIAARYT